MRNVWTAFVVLALGSACNPSKKSETEATPATAAQGVEASQSAVVETPAVAPAVAPAVDASASEAAEVTVKAEEEKKEESKAVQGPTTGAVEAQPSTEAPAKKL